MYYPDNPEGSVEVTQEIQISLIICFSVNGMVSAIANFAVITVNMLLLNQYLYQSEQERKEGDGF